MSFCPRCGKALDPDARFCPGCGTPTPTLQEFGPMTGRDLGNLGGDQTTMPGANPAYGQTSPYMTQPFRNTSTNESETKINGGVVITILAIVVLLIIGGIALVIHGFNKVKDTINDLGATPQVTVTADAEGSCAEIALDEV